MRTTYDKTRLPSDDKQNTRCEKNPYNRTAPQANIYAIFLPPANEKTVHQPFCKKVLEDIVQRLGLEDDLFVLEDNNNRKDEVYADLILGWRQHYQTLT